MNVTDEYADIFADAIVQSTKERKNKLRKGLVLGTVDIKKMRDSRCITQLDFAEKYGIPLLTLQNWEQERRRPDVVANIFLHLIESNPDGMAAEIANQRKVSLVLGDLATEEA